METNLLKSIRHTIHYWWLLLLSGIALIGIGIWVFASPVSAYISLSIVFAVGMLFTGIIEISFSVSVHKSMDGWGWIFASGILDIIIGFYLCVYPAITMFILPFIVGFWLLFRGFSAIGVSIDIKSYGASSWMWLLLLGIAVVLFGFLVLLNPAFGVANIIIWTALAFIIAGISRIYFSMEVRKLRKAM